MQSRSSDRRGFHGPQEAGASLRCWQPASSLQQLCSRRGRDELAAAPRQDPLRQAACPSSSHPAAVQAAGAAGPFPAKAACAREPRPLSRAGDAWPSLSSSLLVMAGLPGVWGGPSNTREHAGRNKATLAPRAEQYHIFTVKNMPRTQAERQHRKQLTQQTFHPTKPCFSIRTWFVPALFNTTRML